MSERNEEVLALVRELIVKYPTVDSTQLYDKAVRVFPFLRDDGLRTFHARYVLPVRRAQANAEGRPRKPRKPRQKTVVPAPAPAAAQASPDDGVAPSIENERVRNVLLRFARELAGAESPAEIVGMLAGVDSYVEEIVAPATTG